MNDDLTRTLSEWLRASDHPEWLVAEVESLEIHIYELRKELLEAKNKIAGKYVNKIYNFTQ